MYVRIHCRPLQKYVKTILWLMCASSSILLLQLSFLLFNVSHSSHSPNANDLQCSFLITFLIVEMIQNPACKYDYGNQVTQNHFTMLTRKTNTHTLQRFSSVFGFGKSHILKRDFIRKQKNAKIPFDFSSFLSFLCILLCILFHPIYLLVDIVCRYDAKTKQSEMKTKRNKCMLVHDNEEEYNENGSIFECIYLQIALQIIETGRIHSCCCCW